MTLAVVDSEIQVIHAGRPETLIHYWPMREEKDSLFHDVEGSADAKLKGPTLDDTTFDGIRAPSFDGVDDYAAIKNKTYSTSGVIDSFSVGVWLKTTSDSNVNVIYSFDENNYFEIGLNENGKPFFQTNDENNTTHIVSADTAVDDDTWHQVVCTFQASDTPDKRIYIDGTQDVTADGHGGDSLGSGTTRYGMIGVGSDASSFDGNNDSQFFGGKMAILFHYDERLNATEIADIYNAGRVAVVPDFTIPHDDLISVNITQRADDRKDTGRIKIVNHDGAYDNDGSDPEILSGDRLRFRHQLQGEDRLKLRWTAMARTLVHDIRHFNHDTIRLEAEDYVFGVLSTRTTTNSFDQQPIDGVLDTILGNTSGVTSDQVQSNSNNVDMVFDTKNTMDSLTDILNETSNTTTNATGRGLEFKKISDLTSEFTFSGSDHGGYTVRLDDDDMTNDARAIGGTGQAIDDEQLTQDSFVTVTESSRKQQLISTRKSAISSLSIWTKPTGSGEDLVVRLQKDDSGQPIDPNSSESDIVRKSIPEDELADDDFTRINLADHTLPEPSPWLILESDGSTGQDVGIDSGTSGDPVTYKARFPFPITTRSEDQTSINRHRRRQSVMRGNAIVSLQRASQMTSTAVDRKAEPKEVLKFDAESVRAHRLRPVEMVFIDESNVSGDFLVREAKDTYEENQLDTSLTLVNKNTV